MPLTQNWPRLVFLVGIFTTVKALAALPPEPSIPYYGEEFYHALEQDRLQDDQLKLKLRDILRLPHLPSESGFDQIHQTCPGKGECYQHQVHTYRYARQFMYGELHLEDHPKGGYQVKTFYCGKKLTGTDFPKGGGPGPGRIPNGTVTNTEHLWPQSRFNRHEPTYYQKADVHILVPVLSSVNSNRSNHPFGEVRVPFRPPCATVNRGYMKKGSRQIYFEPPQHHKGDVARALFYFSVRYRIAIDKTQEKYLRKWHQQDPVDHWEIYRNQAVFEFQKTRNPFVDHPGLVDEIQNF